MNAARKHEEKSAVELAEEAFYLLRTAPTGAIACYASGTLPFILACLYYTTDMSRNAFASERLLTGSLGLAVLFIVMKCGQTMFATGLLAHLAGENPPRWSLPGLIQLASLQAFIQPLGLILLPIAFLLLLPFAWAYAFFSNATVLGGEQYLTLRSLCGRSWNQSFLWPLQNHYALMMYQLLYGFVLLNLGILIALLPVLYKMILGVETVFTSSPMSMVNTTFFAGCVGLGYLCVDPLVKTTYVLRCFYGESLRTGRDLRADLMRLRADETSGSPEILP